MRAARYVVIALACVLHLYSHFGASDSGLFLGLLFWSLIPYGVAAIMGCFRMFAPAALGFALGSLAGDIYLFDRVFISPKGPNADYGILLMPVMNTVILGPVGALVVWLGARLFGWQSKEDAA